MTIKMMRSVALKVPENREENSMGWESSAEGPTGIKTKGERHLADLCVSDQLYSES